MKTQFFFAWIFVFVNSEEIGKILRVQLEENGLKTVTMSDGEMLVNFLLDTKGEIKDCKALRRRRMILGMLKYDYDNIGDHDQVSYLNDPNLDVQWYARQCTRFLRQVQVPDEIEFQDVATKQLVNKAYDDTKFCLRFGSNYHPKFNEGNNAEDECCRELKACEFNIPYMNQKHGYLNVEMYDMVECSCLETFKTCLQKLNSEKSLKLNEIFFELLNMKCFQLHEEKTCLKYSKWFDQCEDEFTYLSVSTR